VRQCGRVLAMLLTGRRWRWLVVCPLAVLHAVACGPRQGVPDTASPTDPKGVAAGSAAAASAGGALPPANGYTLVRDARYAGSAACASCHASTASLWRDSHHALAERGAGAAAIAASLPVTTELAGGTLRIDGPLDAMRIGYAPPPHGDASAEAATGSGQPMQPVAGVIGVTPIEQLLVNVGGGRLQALSAAFDVTGREWFDVFGERREADEWGHWQGRGMNWNSMCGECHNTALRRGYRIATDDYATTLVERGIGCEACHGPGAAHAASAGGQSLSRHFDAGQWQAVCASCHSLRANLTGEFEPGAAFLDHFDELLPGQYAGWYPDGQVRLEVYEHAAFALSRMHAAGVTCLDCHDPHRGSVLVDGDALCARCHAPGARADAPDVVAAHGRHPAGPGSHCVDCHMPVTVFMGRDARRDHGFTIPDPALRAEAGVPDACGRCHANRDAAWAQRTLGAWWRQPQPRSSATRARLMAAAETALAMPVADIADGLATTLRDDTPPWRAVAAARLSPFADDARVRAALVQALADTDAGVRRAAVAALEGAAQNGDASAEAAVRTRLDDVVRAVRVAAAWSLRGRLGTRPRAAAELERMLEINADQPGGRLQLAQYRAALGDLGAAKVHLRTAIAWDPRSPSLHRDLALLEDRAGDVQAAVLALAEAVRLAPARADYRFELGLVLAAAGNLDGGIVELREATRLDAQFARAWYNLGLALHQRQDVNAAIDALSRASALAPDDVEVAWGLGSVLAASGHIEQARTALAAVLALDATHAPARDLLQRLDGRAFPGAARVSGTREN